MCGPDIPRPSLGGALAVLTPTAASLSPSSSSSSSSSSTPNSSRASSPGAGAGPGALSGGSIVFHGPQRTSGGIATHATFTPTGAAVGAGGGTASDFDFADYVVRIHETGDLQRPALESPILHRIGFRGAAPRSGTQTPSQTSSEIRVSLAAPLDLGVGGDGIIGRRVTLWRDVDDDGGAGPVAEGIVGFN